MEKGFCPNRDSLLDLSLFNPVVQGNLAHHLGTSSEGNSHDLVPKAEKEFYEWSDPRLPIEIHLGSTSKELWLLLSSCSHPARVSSPLISEAAACRRDQLRVGDHHSETSRDGSNAKGEVHMSRKKLIISLNPHSPKKSLKKVYIYIRAFFLFGSVTGFEGN